MTIEFNGHTKLVFLSDASNPHVETFSHTVSAGDNRVLVVSVNWNRGSGASGTDLTSVKFGSLDLDFQVHVNRDDDAITEIWAIENPPVSTADIEITWNAEIDHGGVASAQNYTGVDQTTPIGNISSKFGSTTFSSLTITADIGNLIVDSIAGEQVTSLTASAGQTVIYNDDNGDSDFGAGSYKDGDGSPETMGWTFGSDDHYAHAAIELNVVASSSSSSSSSSVSSSSSSESSSSSSSSVSSSSSSSSESSSSSSSSVSSSSSSSSISSSSSSSSLSSSSSSSSLSSSSSSLSSSSSSATPGTKVWGQQTGTEEDFQNTFSGNWTTSGGWFPSGSGNFETLNTSGGCLQVSICNPHYLGAFETTIFIDKYRTGSGPDPIIFYKTATTRTGLSAVAWTLYNGVSFTSLGWVKLKIIHQ